MNTIRTLLRSSRLPFLLLSVVCVFLGASVAWLDAGTIDFQLLGLALLGATTAHVGVNTLNEYADFRSGLDSHTVKTPFSGGSGALIDSPQTSGAVLALAVFSLLLTLSAGLYLVSLRGPLLLALGGLGIVIVLGYTPWLNRHPWLCLIAPGLAFGPLMVGGTYFALTGRFGALPWLASLLPFFLANNLLLLNQLPDIAADRKVGRRHFPIAYGIGRSLLVYRLFLLAAAAAILAGVWAAYLPELAVCAVLPLTAGLLADAGARRHHQNSARLTPYLGINVAVTLLTPLLLGLALLLG